MKTKERHHLKENDLVHTIEQTRGFFEHRGRDVGRVLAVVAVVAVIGAGVVVMRQRSASQGQALLAEAMVALNARVVPASAPGAAGDVPAAAQLGATGTFATEEAKLSAALPKLKAAADAYPDSDAGVTARYHLAGALAALGRPAEAIPAFEDVTRRAGSSLYGRMARLGLADAQARAGQLDTAIATWKTLAADTSAEVPVDAILMELARAYVTKGNAAEARKAFTQIVDEHPDSPYGSEARTELERLKGA